MGSFLSQRPPPGALDLGDTMTAPATTARDAIDAAASANGWAMYATTDRSALFTRSGAEIAVQYYANGAVREAVRELAGRRHNQAGRRDAGKREIVLSWLTGERLPEAPSHRSILEPQTYAELLQ